MPACRHDPADIFSLTEVFLPVLQRELSKLTRTWRDARSHVSSAGRSSVRARPRNRGMRPPAQRAMATAAGLRPAVSRSYLVSRRFTLVLFVFLGSNMLVFAPLCCRRCAED